MPDFTQAGAVTVRKSPLFSEVVPFPAVPRSFGRRPISPVGHGLTSIVMVRHGESRSRLAWLVSCTGEYSDAVWIPKAMVTIEMPVSRGILVATMSKAFAAQKNLHPRFIDPARFNAATVEALRDAQARAARKRNFYRGHRQPTSNCLNRNVFA